MNLTLLHQKLIAAARRQPADDRVPYAFEQRVMACLKPLPGADHWGIWATLLWRAAASSLAVTLLLGVLAYSSAAQGPPLDSLAAELEIAVAAVIETPVETW
ncbi:MAG: hypothetical protein FJ387_25070 [Verrucomicrobia bacterium]|nr:hypothetical protein [Verrucomicrobiota bacterium]